VLLGAYMQRGSFRCSGEAVLRIVFALILTTLAACSHPGPQSTLPQQLLFVTLPETRSVAIFAAGSSGDAKPLATIQETAPDTPIDASLDMHGEVFIGNSNGSIKGYDGQNFDYQLVRTIAGPHTGLIHPSSMAVDPSGNVYVTDLGAAPGAEKLVWFSAALSGDIYPTKTVGGPHTGITSPTGIAVDASEEVFVADHDTGKILVFNADARDDATPVSILNGLKGPRSIFVDQGLNIYVSCDGDNSIVVLAPDGPLVWSRTASITSTAMHAPDGVAADNAGRIATAVQGAVLYFAANANGPSTPVLDLKGPEPINPTALMIR
jgi:hypothetical protein